MTREELDRANAAAVSRHSRALGDDPRNPPKQLLDELGENAEEYADGLLVRTLPGPPDDAAVEAWIERNPQAFADWAAKQARVNGTDGRPGTTPRRPAARRKAT